MDATKFFDGLNDAGMFSGSGEVTFDSPAGTMLGTATVNVQSRPEVILEVSSAQIDPAFGTSPLALLAFLHGEKPKPAGSGVTFSIGAHNEERRPTGIRIETDAGDFTATSALLNYSPMALGLGSDRALSFIPNDLVFAARTQESAKYWLMPLQGPFAKYFVRRPGPSHPLGLDDARYFPYVADGRPCGLQIFEAERNPRHPLAGYDALAFGELRGGAAAVDAICHELPVGLQPALSFAIGADVLAPWVETRSEAGDLVHRFFIQAGKRLTEPGFPAFTQLNEFQPNSGIGAFLQGFFALPEEKRQSLIAPLNLLRSGSPGAFTIEDSLTDLVKALDNFCKAHGFVTQDLSARLTPANAAAVKTAIAAARQTLLNLRSENIAAPDQVDVLIDICGRVSNAANTDRYFGMAVKDLLNKFGLGDAEILDRYLLGKGSTTWAALLSKLRGQVIHEGQLLILDRQQLRTWFAFARHLHDLCTRIVLCEANYLGTYQASTHNWHGEYRPDRIKPGTQIKDLGFSDVPRTI